MFEDKMSIYVGPIVQSLISNFLYLAHISGHDLMLNCALLILKASCMRRIFSSCLFLMLSVNNSLNEKIFNSLSRCLTLVVTWQLQTSMASQFKTNSLINIDIYSGGTRSNLYSNLFEKYSICLWILCVLYLLGWIVD